MKTDNRKKYKDSKKPIQIGKMTTYNKRHATKIVGTVFTDVCYPRKIIDIVATRCHIF